MNSATGIPKRIIQTGKTRQLSLLEQAAVANLTALNSGFEYVYFDDNEVKQFVSRNFPEYEVLFSAFPHRIQRFDFFRYLAVYSLGGFYFDLDVFLARGLSDLTQFECVFPFEELTINTHLRKHFKQDWELGNYAFGATAGHPFVHSIIENCVRAQRDPKWVAPMMSGVSSLFRSHYEVLNTTGPGLVTRTFAENDVLAERVTVLFPDDVCDERMWHNFGDFGVHLMAGSWRGRGNFIRRKIAAFWENKTRRRCINESRLQGKSRKRSSASKAPQ